jgi:hypothetical protein
MLQRTENARALQITDVSHRQNDFIDGYHLVSKVYNDTKLFHGLSANNEVILWLTVLVVFDHIRFCVEPFAIRIFEEVQLHPGFTLHLEDPIQSILRLWNQPF